MSSAAFTRAANRGFGNGFRLAGKRDHGAIVVGIAGAVEDPRACDAAHGVHERVNLCQVAPFGKIWHTFDQAVHEALGICAGSISYEGAVTLRAIRPFHSG